MLKLFSVGACLLLVASVTSTPLEFWNWQRNDKVLEPFADGTSYRLPNNTFPLRYNIELTTHLHLPDDDPEKFKFEGKVRIHVQAKETTSYVTVHARQLRILTSRIINDRGEQIEWLDKAQPEFDAAREFLTYRVKDYLYPDEIVILEIEYSGFLRQDNGGFYRSSYLDAEGNTKWLATTQFESTNARHAFPSYDEPQIRSVYGLTINSHKSFVPISNMPVQRRVEK